MTNQEAFNRMVTHLRAQGQRSTDGWACRYRSKEGLRCAVGVLVTDEFYTTALEGRSMYQKTMKELVSNALPGVSLELLSDMQFVHDATSIDRWEDCWKAIAAKFLLTMPEWADQPKEELCALSSASE